MSRFILNLLGLTVHDNATSTQLHSMQWNSSRLAQVAETIVRDMGADLHDDLSEDEGEHEYGDGDGSGDEADATPDMSGTRYDVGVAV